MKENRNIHCSETFVVLIDSITRLFGMIPALANVGRAGRGDFPVLSDAEAGRGRAGDEGGKRLLQIHGG